MEQTTESIDIRATPEIMLINEGGRDQLESKLAEAIVEAETRREVQDLLAVVRQAEERQRRVKASRDTLAAHAEKLETFLRDVARLDEWIEFAADGKIPDAQVLSKVGKAEAELAVVNRCMERIRDVLTPRHELMRLLAAAEHQEGRAVALDAVAKERSQRFMRTLQEATNEQGAVKVDMRTGVIGMLLEHANQASDLSGQIKLQAVEWAQKHEEALEG